MKARQLIFGIFALVAATMSHAQPTPSPTAEMTFFGYTMGQVSPRWRGKSEYDSYMIDTTRYWNDKFRVEPAQAPRFVNGPMRVKLQTTGDGVIQEATFELNVFKTETEMLTQSLRDQRINELIKMVSEKLGSAPTVKQPTTWKLAIPEGNGRYLRLNVDSAMWIRPWGRVHVVGCTFDSYLHDCSSDAVIPVLHIETNAIMEASQRMAEKKKKDKAAGEASRLKM